MKVVSPYACSHVTPLDRPVDEGEVVDVDDELAAQLLEQGWTSPDRGAVRPEAAHVKQAKPAPQAQSEEK